MSVILNEVKNLVESMGWKTEILRLMPQNDIATQSLGGERKRACPEPVRFGACRPAEVWGKIITGSFLNQWWNRLEQKANLNLKNED
jgi:hypothetical protein